MATKKTTKAKSGTKTNDRFVEQAGLMSNVKKAPNLRQAQRKSK